MPAHHEVLARHRDLGDVRESPTRAPAVFRSTGLPDTRTLHGKALVGRQRPLRHANAEGDMCLGIPGQVVEIRDDGGFPVGTVDFGGVRREVCLSYVADTVAPGDYVIVHVGFAISKVDQDEAQRTFDVLREMSRLDELEWMADALPAGTAPAARPDGR